jgi:hypothetical protein
VIVVEERHIASQAAGRATLFPALSMTGDAVRTRMVPGEAQRRLRDKADYRRGAANAPRKTNAARVNFAHDTD